MNKAAKPPTLALIVAMARNGVIGRDNELPWHIPDELRHFKRVTLGKPVVMGRRTFESIGRPLPGRTNIVVTRQAGFKADGVQVAGGLGAALALAEAAAQRDGVDEIMIIGGGALYAESLPQIQRIYLTEIDAEVSGDTYFPALEPAQWRESRREPRLADNGLHYSLVVLERCN